MTKFNKIKKSTFAILALSLVLVAVLAFGGTYAYFSASDSLAGTRTLGTLTVDLAGTDTTLSLKADYIVPNERITDNSYALAYGTGDEATNINFYIRVVLTTSTTATGELPIGEVAIAELLQFSGMAKWVGVKDAASTTGTYTYYFVNAENKDTSANVASVAVATAPTTIDPIITVNAGVGHNGSRYYMGESVTVTLSVEVLQADYLYSSTEAATAKTVTQLHNDWSAKVANTTVVVG